MPTRHGHAARGAPTGEYNSWAGMIARCTNERCPAFRLYGGRGIRVCERWRSFENFLADMGPRPTGTSLDRIDSDGNYEPTNCRWAASVDQTRNRRANRIITFDGRSLCLVDWAAEFGIRHQTLAKRLDRGMTMTEAVQRPLRSRAYRVVEFNGRRYSVGELVKLSGLSAQTIRYRLDHGLGGDGLLAPLRKGAECHRARADTG